MNNNISSSITKGMQDYQLEIDPNTLAKCKPHKLSKLFIKQFLSTPSVSVSSKLMEKQIKEAEDNLQDIWNDHFNHCLNDKDCSSYYLLKLLCRSPEKVAKYKYDDKSCSTSEFFTKVFNRFVKELSSAQEKTVHNQKLWNKAKELFLYIHQNLETFQQKLPLLSDWFTIPLKIKEGQEEVTYVNRISLCAQSLIFREKIFGSQMHDRFPQGKISEINLPASLSDLWLDHVHGRRLIGKTCLAQASIEDLKQFTRAVFSLEMKSLFGVCLLALLSKISEDNILELLFFSLEIRSPKLRQILTRKLQEMCEKDTLKIQWEEDYQCFICDITLTQYDESIDNILTTILNAPQVSKCKLRVKKHSILEALYQSENIKEKLLDKIVMIDMKQCDLTPVNETQREKCFKDLFETFPNLEVLLLNKLEYKILRKLHSTSLLPPQSQLKVLQLDLSQEPSPIMSQEGLFEEAKKIFPSLQAVHTVGNDSNEYGATSIVNLRQGECSLISTNPDSIQTLDLDFSRYHEFSESTFILSIETIYKCLSDADMHFSYVNICLKGCNFITSEGLKILFKYFKNIQKLDLTNCPNVDDKALAEINNRYILTTLHLNNCNQITDAGIAWLAQWTKGLKVLSVSGCCQLTDRSIVTISQNYPELASLSFHGCPLMTDQAIDALIKVYFQPFPVDLQQVNDGYAKLYDANIQLPQKHQQGFQEFLEKHLIQLQIDDLCQKSGSKLLLEADAKKLADLLQNREILGGKLVNLPYFTPAEQLTLQHTQLAFQETNNEIQHLIQKYNTPQSIKIKQYLQYQARLKSRRPLQHIDLDKCPKISSQAILNLIRRAYFSTNVVFTHLDYQNCTSTNTDEALRILSIYGSIEKLLISNLVNSTIDRNPFDYEVPFDVLGSLMQKCRGVKKIDCPYKTMIFTKMSPDFFTDLEEINGISALTISEDVSFYGSFLEAIKTKDIVFTDLKNFHVNIHTLQSMKAVPPDFIEILYSLTLKAPSLQNILMFILIIPSSVYLSEDQLFSLIQKMRVLNYVSLSNREFSDKLLSEIAQNKALGYLQLDGSTGFSAGGLVDLIKRCAELKYLSLRGCSSLSAQAILFIVQHCQNLKALDLSDLDELNNPLIRKIIQKTLAKSNCLITFSPIVTSSSLKSEE